MKVSNLLHEEDFSFLTVSTREEALKLLCQKAFEKGYIPDLDAFQKAILEREGIMSTGIGLGVAVPHCKMDSLEDFFIISSVLSDPVEWDAIDSVPVKAIFMIGGPSRKHKEYLQLLSKLILLVKNPTRREQLFAVQSASQILALFDQF